MPDIQIPASELQGLIGKAIIDSLSEDTRTTIIQAAVEHLITPPTIKQSYGPDTKGTSPLQLAFNRAVDTLSQDVARELVVEMRPRITQELRDMIADLPESLADDWDMQRKIMGLILNKAVEITIEKTRDLY